MLACYSSGEYKIHDQSVMDNSPKLYLLWERLQPNKDNSKTTQKTLWFRHYLSVSNAQHRKAITCLVLSNHALAIERLRWSEHRRPQIERAERKCRFCELAESPEHALLDCTSNATLIEIRTAAMNKIYGLAPHIPRIGSTDSVVVLRTMLAQRSTINILARYTHEVLTLYGKSQIYNVPPLPTHWMIH